uniref:Transmembrane protein n=1 Tax=Marseillevirus LCMAC202 TaxID=2506606 RepID=A0A481YWX2_9VIRU|nr:MAG: hypothetical protein LCMAC202_00040 [Marseillevirus LCMAC202]
MKLKLSTLVVIIGIIFFAYYYFIYSPCQPAESKQPPYIPMPPVPEEAEESRMINYGNELTPLDIPFGNEGFEVTALDDYNGESSQAGNVRPDNVMRLEEPVTML